LELALSQEVYEYLEELDEMNWSARGNVLNQYLRNTSIGTTVKQIFRISNICDFRTFFKFYRFMDILPYYVLPHKTEA
jgi:hypothetical protein